MQSAGSATMQRLKSLHSGGAKICLNLLFAVKIL